MHGYYSAALAAQPNLNHSTLCLTLVSVHILVYQSQTIKKQAKNSNDGNKGTKASKRCQQRRGGPHGVSVHWFQCPQEPCHGRDHGKVERHLKCNGPGCYHAHDHHVLLFHQPVLPIIVWGKDEGREILVAYISSPRSPKGGNSMEYPPPSRTPKGSWNSSRTDMSSSDWTTSWTSQRLEW